MLSDNISSLPDLFAVDGFCSVFVSVSVQVPMFFLLNDSHVCVPTDKWI